MTLLAWVLLVGALLFAILFLLTFVTMSDGISDMTDDDPTLDVQNHRGDE